MTDQVNEAVAWLYTYPHDGESDHCLSASRLLPSWVAAKGATEQPLYTHPSRGVVDDAMVDMAMDADALEYGASIPASRVRRILQAAALPAVPEAADAPTGTVADIADAELLRRAVRHLAPRSRRQPAWARIMDVFGLGSTYSHQLCRRFGLDPDNGKPIKLAATPAHDQPEGSDNG